MSEETYPADQAIREFVEKIQTAVDFPITSIIINAEGTAEITGEEEMVVENHVVNKKYTQEVWWPS